jgi:hypothetical protein
MESTPLILLIEKDLYLKGFNFFTDFPLRLKNVIPPKQELGFL